jgi:pyridoxal 5'-phosphate synthase pdxS subunit
MAQVKADIKHVQDMAERDLGAEAERMRVPVELVQEVRELGRLPVVTFVAGGIATPADAALMMQMGADGVFVGSGIFKSSNPALMAKAIVQATTHYNDPKMLAEISSGLGDAMRGQSVASLPKEELLAVRGW